MRYILIFLIFLFTCISFSQENINYFNGDFNLALEQAKSTNKNIFFITRSESCPVFSAFQQNITHDTETIKYLNNEFVVFEFDMDTANEEEIKRLKKYYHSWRAFPQIYFIDKNEKLISDIIYSLNYTQEENLEIWKNYTQIESDWKTIKKVKNRDLTLENLKMFLLYRQIKYSSFDLIQIKNTIDKYFNNILEENYSDKENWFLFNKYITIYSNPDLFDYVANNKKDFESKNSADKVSSYLTKNYNEVLSWKSKEERELLVNEYPFNTVTEAKEALENYKETEPSFGLTNSE